MTLDTMFATKSLIPVVVIDRAEDAVPLAEALLEGGIKSIEITLRTPAGMAAIEQVAKHVPDIIVGSGTVLNAEQMTQAKNAGAVFQVSPGLTDSLAQHAADNHIEWLPGITNASGIMQALQAGHSRVKFFPASLSGGVPVLKQFGSVFPDLKICPTGGISMDNMNDYAALGNVFAIGGSWLTPKDLIANKEWTKITTIAKDSVAALNA